MIHDNLKNIPVFFIDIVLKKTKESSFLLSLKENSGIDFSFSCQPIEFPIIESHIAFTNLI